MRRREFIGVALAGVVAFEPGAFAAAVAEGKPKTLVLGGGAFALGYALAHPQETLVLERTIHLGLDYAGTCGPVAPGTPTTPLGRELVAKLAEVGILKNGVMELPPLADFLAVFFAEHGGRAFMKADIVAIHPETPGGCWVSIVGGGAEGISDFMVESVLDTTDRGWRDFGADAIRSQRFGGLQRDFSYFTVDLKPSDGWHEARLKLYEAWKQAGHRPDELLAEVNAIKCLYGDRRVQRRNDKLRCPWIPSGQFADLVTAFEEGLKWHAE